LPCPLPVQEGSRDAPLAPAGVQEAVAQIAAAYAKAGVRERISSRLYDVPPAFSQALQEEAVAWLDRPPKE
jgi:hypothetical protein